MKFKQLLSAIALIISLYSCTETSKNTPQINEGIEVQDEFIYLAEQFADIKVLRYQIPGFDQLSLQQKKYVYYLTQAGLAGRDIIYDQNYRYNLTIRRALENVYQDYQGDKNNVDWKNFETYLKQIWFANGIHHHYSSDKFKPQFSQDYLKTLLKETKTILDGLAFDIIFNDVDSKKVNLNPKTGLIKGSAVNFYSSDITAKEVEEYYSKIKVNTKTPIEKGLNSKLVKEDGVIKEKFWKSGACMALR